MVKAITVIRKKGVQHSLFIEYCCYILKMFDQSGHMFKHMRRYNIIKLVNMTQRFLIGVLDNKINVDDVFLNDVRITCMSFFYFIGGTNIRIKDIRFLL